MPASVEFFKKYLSPCFVETGSYRGNGIKMALEAGFPEVRSVELNRDNYEHCVDLFKGDKRVKLYHGSSSDLLNEMMQDIDEPVTFWLDAHYSGKGTAKTDGSDFSPILKEIDNIKKHPIKSHTILIDDRRDFGTRNFDHVTEEEAVEKIKEINENYKISRETGSTESPLFKNDILVAKV